MIQWTDYMQYRLKLRGFDRDVIEQILRYSDERYVDTATGRSIVVGKHRNLLVMIPFERSEEGMVPVTIHTTSREQINMRRKAGRLRYE